MAENTNTNAQSISNTPVAGASSVISPGVFYNFKPENPAPGLATVPAIFATCTLPDGQIYTATFDYNKATVLDVSSYQITKLSWAMFNKGPNTPSILGAHLFTTARADGFVECALLFSNAGCKVGDSNSFCGGVYFTKMEITINTRNSIVANLRYKEEIKRNKYVLVSGNTIHYFPERAQCVRRFVLCPNQVAESMTLGQAILNLSSLELPATYNKFGPSQTNLQRPTVNTIDDIGLAAAVTNGQVSQNFHLLHTPMGLFTPESGSAPDEVGGEDIEFVSGWELTQKAARYHRLRADLKAERMPLCQFDKDTGKLLGMNDWKGAFEYRLTRGYAGILQIPVFAAQTTSTWNVFLHKKFNFDPDKPCLYEADLYSYFPFDDAHLIRGFLSDKASWWLSHDYVSRFRLGIYANDIQTSWTTYATGPDEPAYGGQWIPFSLKHALYTATKKPNQGGFLGRSVGWPMDCVAASFQAGNDTTTNNSWLVAMDKLLGLSVMPTGVCYHGEPPSSDNGVPWNTDGLALNYGEAPVFQIPILWQGEFEASIVIGNMQNAKMMICRSADQLYENPALPFVQSEYGGSAIGPHWYIVVADGNIPVNSLSMGVGNSHWMHCFNHLAQAYRLSRNEKYLNDMLKIGVPHATRAALRTDLLNNPDRTFYAETISVLQ